MCEGVLHPDFSRYPVHAESLTRWIAKYLRAEKALDPDEIPAFAAVLVELAQQVYTLIPAQKPAQKERSTPKSTKKAKPDLMAIPQDRPTNGGTSSSAASPKPAVAASRSQVAPRQLVLFNLPQAYA